MIIWLSIAAGLGVISAVVARSKGLPPIRWGLAGILLGIVVVPYLLLSPGRGYAKAWRPVRFGIPGREAACPHCGAKVDAYALVCRQCRTFLGNGFGRPDDEPEEGEEAAVAPDTTEDGDAKRPAPAQRAAAARRSEATAKAEPRTTNKKETSSQDKEVPGGIRIGEEALRNPMFRRLDDAFARMSGEGRPRAPRQETEQAAERSPHGEDRAAARHAASAPPPRPAAAPEPPPVHTPEPMGERSAVEPVAATAPDSDARPVPSELRPAESPITAVEPEPTTVPPPIAGTARPTQPTQPLRQQAAPPPKAPSEAVSSRMEGADADAHGVPTMPQGATAEEIEPTPEARPKGGPRNGKATFGSAFRINPADDQKLAFPPTDHLLSRETQTVRGPTAPNGDPQPAVPVDAAKPAVPAADEEDGRRMPTLDTRPRTLRATDEPNDRRRRLPGDELRAIPPIGRVEPAGGPPARGRRRGADGRDRRSPTNRPYRRRASTAVALGAVAVGTVLFAAYSTPDWRAPWAPLLSPPVPLAPAGSDVEPVAPTIAETTDAGGAIETPEALLSDNPDVAAASPEALPLPARPAPSLAAPSAPPAGGPEAPVAAPAKPPAPPAAPAGRVAVAPRKEAPRQPVEEDFASVVRRALEERRDRSATYRELDDDSANGISATGETVTLVQQRLQERGYDPGRVDGLGGPRTRAAIRAFQRDNDLAVDGKIDMELLQQLGLVGKRIHVFQSGSGPSLTP